MTQPDASPALPPPSRTPSPLRLLLVLAASVFVAELLIMIAFLFLPAFPPAAEALIDATALVLLSAPLLYGFGFRPLLREIAARGRVEAELRQLNLSMEQRVAERTRALAASAEVSRRLSTLLDQRQLVVEVVERIQKTFGFYHAHIYLYDERRENLVMAGGTGEAGRLMLARGHQLPTGRGLVGRTAETNAPVLVPDVTQDPDWLPNPLLPETRAEVAVPIALGSQVLGVLDVQHNVVNGLTPDDAQLLRAIADQAAVALQNARQYAAAAQQAQRESVLNVIAQKIQSAGTVEDVLLVAARELGQALGERRVAAQLGVRPREDNGQE